MLFLLIDRESRLSLTRQVYGQIRDKILKRELRAGDKLPPTRKLSEELGVARNVIIEAYEQLFAEGFLETQQGSGTYVARESYLEQYTDHYERVRDASMPENREQTEDVVAFDSGTPDLSRFPKRLWALHLKEVSLRAAETSLDYGPPEGSLELRVHLSEFLLRTKGFLCPPDQLFVLSGSAQAFIILAQLLKLSSDGLIVEDPVYNGIQRIFLSLNVSLLPVPVDDRGIQVELISASKLSQPVLITPSHQFPFGCVLPIQRRIRLIELARKANTYLIENDYDSEFRYVGAPISSLHLLDPERVIYIGTFSESMYPGLRLGYMVLPSALVEDCREVVKNLSLSVSGIKQLALSSFIKEGHLERHVTRMKRLYREKRKILIRSLEEAFGEEVNISGDSTGLYVMASFQDVEFTDELMRRLEARRVRIERVEDHAIVKGRHKNKIILGYGNLGIGRIQEGIHRLKQVLEKQAA